MCSFVEFCRERFRSDEARNRDARDAHHGVARVTSLWLRGHPILFPRVSEIVSRVELDVSRALIIMGVRLRCLSMHARYRCHHSGACCSGVFAIPAEALVIRIAATLGLDST